MLLALNKRLQADYTSMQQVFDALEQKNMTFGQIISIPEQDDWVYEDGYSMVCSSFVARMYKEAGLIKVPFQGEYCIHCLFLVSNRSDTARLVSIELVPNYN